VVAEFADAFPLSVPAETVALEVDGTRLTLVLATHYDLEVGRVVTFEGSKPLLVAKAPGLDPNLVALTEGVLVAMGAPGAWDTLCASQSRMAMSHRRSLWPWRLDDSRL
jgi:hypothetical protein